jgi:Txe/YoeB family toxin of Txe-Axe toxin-antitoxin module
MRQLVFDGGTFDDFCRWATEDKKTFKKILELLKSITGLLLKELVNRNL